LHAEFEKACNNWPFALFGKPAGHAYHAPGQVIERVVGRIVELGDVVVTRLAIVVPWPVAEW